MSRLALFAAAAFGFAALAVACGNKGDPEGPVVAATFPASPSPATTRAASPVPPGHPCPFDDAGICAAAARVEHLLVTLNFDEFTTFAVERTVACPAATVPTPGHPASLCTGKAAGDQVTGYSAGVRRGGTAVYSREDFKKFLQQTRVDEQPQRSDAYGSGLLRVASTGDASDAGCRDCYRVELTRLQLSGGQPVRRAVSVWLAKQAGGDWRPVIVLVGSYGSQKETDAQVRGGTFDGVTYSAWATGAH